MSLKRADDATIGRLNVSSEVGREVADRDVGETFWRYVATEAVLEKENVTLNLPKVIVPVANPLLVQDRGHPCLRIVAIIKAQLLARLLLKGTELRRFTNDKGRKALATISVHSECISKAALATLDTMQLLVHETTIRRHTVSYISK